MRSVSRRSFNCIAVSGLGGSALMGCATLFEPKRAENSLPLTFIEPGVQAQMAVIELLDPFVVYWTAHAQREWRTRYQMELFQKPIAQSFYEAYYAAAWKLVKFDVTSMSPADSKGRVRVKVNVVFANPTDHADVANSSLEDWWTRADEGAWRHLNVDPMLNDLKPVV